MIRDILRTMLEALNLNVFLASDGLEAVAFASRIQASLVILDLKMARLNGLLACERIRLLPGYGKTPIVILTGVPGRNPQAAAARVGATAYFAKPFSPAILLQGLSRFLPISDVRRDLIRRNADSSHGIAWSAQAPSAQVTLATHASGGPPDRGKDILDVLRG